MTHYIYVSALDWLGRGYGLLPLIPGTKYIVKGFTIDQPITDLSVAYQWFLVDPKKYNLAVVCPPGHFVLDFDDWSLYCRWIKYVSVVDESISLSYSELTPSGGVHVFLSGDVPPGYRARSGVEIKRHCVVAPSLISGSDFDYEVFGRGGDIYHGSLDACFFFLSGFFRCVETLPPPPRPARLAPSVSTFVSRLDQIKGRLSIVDIFKKYYPRHKLTQRGRYYNTTCPFHADKKPSFYLDTQLNIYGCHACKARGDVINLYALAKRIGNKQAIDQLMIYAQ